MTLDEVVDDLRLSSSKLCSMAQSGELQAGVGAKWEAETWTLSTGQEANP